MSVISVQYFSPIPILRLTSTMKKITESVLSGFHREEDKDMEESKTYLD